MSHDQRPAEAGGLRAMTRAARDRLARALGGRSRHDGATADDADQAADPSPGRRGQWHFPPDETWGPRVSVAATARRTDPGTPALADPDPPLDFGGGAADADAVDWEIVAPFAALEMATQRAGLDPNAVRRTGPDDDPAAEASVPFPSAFCTDPVVFLGILAVLVRATPHVRLFRVRPGAGDGADAALVKVFPEPGAETLAVLVAFHPDAAEQVRATTRMVADALAHLEVRTEEGDGRTAL
ncbi:hypothetical protein [Roseospira navarrensis]|uniref:Uncharacterized protein n=1 Tax=Roseospira navarrensis TaxID=140058 RepID=A0A7X2D505_9PROT|nr:hypothetical protein [Roseospira navarrensis]MQX37177.1 hypothetical protein [Roseospira navarrensis]